MKIFYGNKLWISSREINLSNGITFNDDIDLLGRDELSKRFNNK
jgi:hypothetical protein